MRKTMALVACSALLILAGCGNSQASNNSGADEAGTAAALDGMDMTAKVSPETATVEFPGDKFQLSEAEGDRLAVAEQVAWALCAQKLDIPEYAREPGSRDAPEYAMFSDLGPWTEDMANRFAFTRPEPLITESKEKNYPPELSDEQFNIVEKKCKTTPEAEYFNALRLDKIAPAVFDLQFSEIEQTKLPKSKEYQAALKDLYQCYKEVGIREEERKEGNYSYRWVVGADSGKVDEQQITLALKAVQCKTKVDFINRVAQEVAKIQAPVIKKNIKDFSAWRKEADEALKKAEEYIAAHPDAIWKG